MGAWFIVLLAKWPVENWPTAFVLLLLIWQSARSEWLLHDVRSREAFDGFAHGTVELWDTERRLVAIASQRALVRDL